MLPTNSCRAYARHFNTFIPNCQRLQPQGRRTWRAAHDRADAEPNKGEGDNNDQPISLAALSKVQSQGKRRQQCSRDGNPRAPSSRSQPLPPAAATRSSEHGNATMHTSRLTRSGVSQAVSISGRSKATLASSEVTPSLNPAPAPVSITLSAESETGSAFASQLDRTSEARPEPGSKHPGPEPRHMPVAFRTVAELRLWLQERQAAAGQAMNPVMAVAEMEADGEAGGPLTEVAAVAAPVSPVAKAPPPPLRRFFGAVPMRDAGLQPTTDADQPAESSNRASNESPLGSISISGARGIGIDTRSSSGGSSGSSGLSGRVTRADPAVTAEDAGPIKATSYLCSGSVPANTSGAATSVAPARSAEAPLGRMGPSAGIRVGSELEQDGDFLKARADALAVLQRSPQPTSGLARKLLARGHPRRILEPLLTWLTEGGALNDRIYARLYATSKWNSNLIAPSKIKQDLTVQGVAVADVEAALTHVFGPSQRIRLTGPATPEELAIRELLLGAAQRHVEQRGGSASAASSSSGSSERGPAFGYSMHRSKSAPPPSDEDQTASGNRRSTSAAGGGLDSSRSRRADLAKKVKEQNSKRRRLAGWLQYRGHEMEVVLKVFELLKI